MGWTHRMSDDLDAVCGVDWFAEQGGELSIAWAAVTCPECLTHAPTQDAADALRDLREAVGDVDWWAIGLHEDIDRLIHAAQRVANTEGE